MTKRHYFARSDGLQETRAKLTGRLNAPSGYMMRHRSERELHLIAVELIDVIERSGGDRDERLGYYADA